MESQQKGAGGTRGGVGAFLLGAAMTIAGGYLLLTSLHVVNGFGGGLFGFGGFRVTGGMIMILFVIGIGFVFYDSSKWYGWALAAGSLLALVVGAIASVRFAFDGMSAFDLIVVLILLFGGIGLVLRSVKESPS
ncbi:MAG TPA: hypothetical protein VFT54_04620 [Acidimicrobiia bacterium]|nr:hypothetical protein [Acidimicrobiia bacterium]